ncbi:MAG TPA: maleylacetate reductase [Caulobacterales bacterium]|jgi:alcohol dehydrogenase class IV|nr:maleylacetate reductase [Caulobacterales bacterium]
MQAFNYAALPGKVLFGFGTLARVSDEIRALGCSRAIVLSTPEQETTAQAVKAQIGELAAGVVPWATMHTPTDVTERAMAAVQSMRGDCVVAVGGGSTTGLGKAIALRTDMPQIVIPTTYAGSEATPILGETRDGIKTTQRSLKVLPEVILYDVDLTMTLPPALSATSGMNAIAHAAEALYAQDANPIVSLIAEEGVRALASALPAIIANPGDREARSDALYGAWACGVCLGSVGMALHHKLCHVLGGSFDLPHAPTHTVILPYAIAYNAAAAPGAMKRLSRALGAPEAAKGLFDLARSLGAPTSLQAIGMPQEGLDRAADLAVQNPYWNPRAIERGAIRALLDDAYFGRAPSSSAERDA